MSKAYWHAVGTGALSSGGPWNTPHQRGFRRGAAAQRFIGRTLLLSVLLTFLVGVTIGVYQDLSQTRYGAQETAVFASQLIGRIIHQSIEQGMMLLSLHPHAMVSQDNMLYYLMIPYQISSFLGAYAATSGLLALEHLLVMSGAHW